MVPKQEDEGQKGLKDGIQTSVRVITITHTVRAPKS